MNYLNVRIEHHFDDVVNHMTFLEPGWDVQRVDQQCFHIDFMLWLMIINLEWLVHSRLTPHLFYRLTIT